MIRRDAMIIREGNGTTSPAVSLDNIKYRMKDGRQLLRHLAHG